jgi:hypothetical protein
LWSSKSPDSSECFYVHIPRAKPLNFSCLVYCFIYWMYSCVLVDIVPVSSEQPVEVDQEQVFEEEGPQCLSKESKWSSPPTLFYFILCNCKTIKFILFWYCIKLMGTPLFKDLPRFLSTILGSTLFNKCFWVEYACCSTWVG